MPVLLLLFGIVCLPILFVIGVLFAIIVGLWKLLSWISQFPTWLYAMTVVLTLLTGLCLIKAVTSW